MEGIMIMGMRGLLLRRGLALLLLDMGSMVSMVSMVSMRVIAELAE